MSRKHNHQQKQRPHLINDSLTDTSLTSVLQSQKVFPNHEVINLSDEDDDDNVEANNDNQIEVVTYNHEQFIQDRENHDLDDHSDDDDEDSMMVWLDKDRDDNQNSSFVSITRKSKDNPNPRDVDQITDSENPQISPTKRKLQPLPSNYYESNKRMRKEDDVIELNDDSEKEGENEMNDEYAYINAQMKTIGLYCPVCPHLATTRVSLQNHLSKQHGYQYHCNAPGCREQFNDRFWYLEHINTHIESQTKWACPECQTVVSSQERLTRHWNRYHEKGIFGCIRCPARFSFCAEVVKHCELVHKPTQEFSCLVDGCLFRVTQEAELRRHQMCHTTLKPYKCTWENCSRLFNNSQHAVRHVWEIHLAKATKSSYTYKYIKNILSQETINREISKLESRKRDPFLQLSSPHFTLPKLKLFQNQILNTRRPSPSTVTDNRDFYCPFTSCSYKSNVRYRWASHILSTHSTLKPFRCTWAGCRAEFQERRQNLRHVRCAHFNLKSRETKPTIKPESTVALDPQQFIDQRYDIEELLMMNLGRLAIGESDLQIEQEETYSEKKDDQHSIAIDDNQMDDEANEEVPSSSFKQAIKEIQQQQQDSTGTPFVCDFPSCTRMFQQRHALVNHSRTHIRDKPHRCTWPFCTASFQQKPNLASHMNTHTGVRPYACDHPGCKWSFANKGNLAKHRFTHTGQRPHQCEECGWAFSRLSNLRNHRLIHARAREIPGFIG